ncbi:hypothetical protein [Mariniflexile sp. AS56]|uniref:hypothetical protein n=1 Tax=Mariniflexile sp. AS56 TaxID=3063957 RepID=UPI0026EA7B79|nr:hypothetical protein [Mariniflexile sp. AS56]MDO7172601.1 hypothetical protein [Mariniflexile sp. AS56]
MKFTTATVIVCFLSSNVSFGQLISADDKLHLAAGAIISATTYSIVYRTTKNKKKAFWYSLGTSVFAGVSKELYDSLRKDKEGYYYWDTGEAIASSLGGFTMSTTLCLFVGNKKQKKTALVH